MKQEALNICLVSLVEVQEKQKWGGGAFERDKNSKIQIQKKVRHHQSKRFSRIKLANEFITDSSVGQWFDGSLKTEGER